MTLKFVKVNHKKKLWFHVCVFQWECLCQVGRKKRQRDGVSFHLRLWLLKLGPGYTVQVAALWAINCNTCSNNALNEYKNIRNWMVHDWFVAWMRKKKREMFHWVMSLPLWKVGQAQKPYSSVSAVGTEMNKRDLRMSGGWWCSHLCTRWVYSQYRKFHYLFRFFF